MIYEIQNHLFDNAKLRSLLEKILPKKTEMNDYEIHINLPDHRECTMLLNARHVINEKNKEQLILLAMEDITERKTAEQKQETTRVELEEKNKQIEASEKRFSNLILQAPMLINTLIGPSFIIETINKTALGIWQKSYEEVINKPLFDSSPEMEKSMKKILTDVYTTGEPFRANEIPVRLI